MRVVLAAALVAAVTACGSGLTGPPGPTSPAASSTPGATGTHDRWRTTVVRSARGGLCPDGEVCHTEVVVHEDGRWERAADGGGAGTVDPAAVDALAGELLERWEALTAEPFTGTCPTAYDGAEMGWRLRRIPTGPGAHLRDADVRETSSCRHAWPERAARSLGRRWREAGLPDVP